MPMGMGSVDPGPALTPTLICKFNWFLSLLFIHLELGADD